MCAGWLIGSSTRTFVLSLTNFQKRKIVRTYLLKFHNYAIVPSIVVYVITSFTIEFSRWTISSSFCFLFRIEPYTIWYSRKSNKLNERANCIRIFIVLQQRRHFNKVYHRFSRKLIFLFVKIVKLNWNQSRYGLIIIQN